VLSLASPAVASAQASCRFSAGFAALQARLGPAVAGECAENEHAVALSDPPGSSGTAQRTSRGLFVWRQADNWTAFTDGYRTWVSRADGVYQRLIDERFLWEAGAAASGLPLRYAGAISVPETMAHPAYELDLPNQVVPRGATLDALLVLHGIGVDGPTMAATVRSQAQSRGLAVIAPTIPYGDWQNPAVVREEDLRNAGRLAGILASVRDETGVPLSPRVLIFGFSRGAQTASRFALFRPEFVRAVTSFSAGTYTLPLNSVSAARGQRIVAPLPYGVSDLAQATGRGFDVASLAKIPWLVGAGANDRQDADVPRQWDAFEGTNRVQRAQRFGAALGQIGAPVQVVVLPNTGHEINGAMLDQVFSFFDQLTDEA
jgi:predicted esterase